MKKQELMIDNKLVKALLVETFGTGMLIFAGVGAIIANAMSQGSLGHIGIALSFGLIIMIMIYAVGHISGAHFNPAVTLGFTLTRHFPSKHLLPYWAAQCIGAVIGGIGVTYLLGNHIALGVTQPSVPLFSAFIIEIILTGLLMFVIMAVATDSRAVGEAAAIAVGATITLEGLFAGPFTGASMNPARSLAPALLSGNLSHLWIYLSAPFIGAVFGAFAYKWIGTYENQEKIT